MNEKEFYSRLALEKNWHLFECGGCGQYLILPEMNGEITIDRAIAFNKNVYNKISCPNCGAGFRRIH